MDIPSHKLAFHIASHPTSFSIPGFVWISLLKYISFLAGKWAYSRDESGQHEFTSRYDRMAGGLDNYKIFDSDMPG